MSGYERHAETLRPGGPYDDPPCDGCGVAPDEACAPGCTLRGARLCGCCQGARGEYVPALGVWRCEACGPLTTAHARMMRGEL